ncbi:MAG TPA: HAD-IIA family hydrolase [Anaerolineaceae bacterium]|nr:HAD-IIA family hydrolase [Anaerolineaceae bacterium]
MKKIKSLIFDMDGVLWQDDKPLGNLQQIFQEIRKDNIRYAFATNNSTRTPAEYYEKLIKLGIPSSPDLIMTSALALVKMMLQKFPKGGPVFIFGENGLIKALNAAGFYHQEQQVLAVVGGLDRQINYEIFKKVILLLQQNIDFYFTNIDTTFPTPLGKVPGAGSILKAIEVASGKKAITAGKPEPMMYNLAISSLNSKPETTLVIGDRLDTDILGGIHSNCPTALVLTGISKKEDIIEVGIEPDYIFEDMTDLVLFFSKRRWMME